MKKLFKFAVFGLLLCLLLCSCKTKNDADDVFLEFTDSTGKTVTLKEKPRKVAVLFSSFADIWVTAGGEVAVTVGETVERGFAEDEVLLVDDGAGKKIDTERLVAAEPDLVIYSADIEAQTKCAELLKKANIPVAGFIVEDFDDYLFVLDALTDITGKKELYKKYGSDVKAAVDIFKESKPLEGKRILFIRAGSSARSVKIKKSDDNFAAMMLCDLGAQNIADSNPSMVDNLSLEAVLQSNPDFVFFTSMGDEKASELYVAEMLKGDGWRELECIKQKNYLFLPKELFHYKPNSRWGEAYEYLVGTFGSN